MILGFKVNDMTNIELLQEVVNEIDELKNLGVTTQDPEFKAWKNKADRVLIKLYGEDSYEFKEFRKTEYSLSVYALSTPKSVFVTKCAEGLTATKMVFENYIRELKIRGNEEIDNHKVNVIQDSVFIVHGHNEILKTKVQLLLQQQGIKGIILSEQTNGGKTIIEKFEEYSDVDAAIILMSSDDEGREKGEKELRERARQNVIFEAGFFMGKLERKKVIIIADTDIEIPSDLQGVVYTNSNRWEIEVLGELKNMGFKVNANILL